MTRILSPSFGLFLSLLIVALFTLQCETDDTNSPRYGWNNNTPADICAYVEDLPTEALSDTEKDALQFMREEEKLARDVYLYLEDKWDHKVFTNISGAEQRHMDAVACLLTKYELTDPAADQDKGVFTNSTLQTLYNDLTSQGEESLEAAFRVGATIEDLDIFDLQQNMVSIDNEDITLIFGELERGSRNHLRAFTRQLNNLDSTYEPVYLTAEVYQDIISSPTEKGGIFHNNNQGRQNGTACSGNCQGNCDGHKQGQNKGQGQGQKHGHGQGGGKCQG